MRVVDVLEAEEEVEEMDDGDCDDHEEAPVQAGVLEDLVLRVVASQDAQGEDGEEHCKGNMNSSGAEKFS